MDGLGLVGGGWDRYARDYGIADRGCGFVDTSASGRQLIDLATWKKAWALLEKREWRIAWIVLGIVIIAALSSAAMMGSIMPFPSVD